MEITQDDKCGVCRKSLYSADDGFKLCELCGAFICDACFEVSKKIRGNICPCCGKDPSKT